MARNLHQLPVVRHDIRRFSWNSEDQTFTAEASDLERRIMSRLYNDACDMGFVIRNPKTGNEVTFSFVSEDKDNEGEIQGWRFESIDWPFGCLKALVIND